MYCYESKPRDAMYGPVVQGHITLLRGFGRNLGDDIPTIDTPIDASLTPPVFDSTGDIFPTILQPEIPTIYEPVSTPIAPPTAGATVTPGGAAAVSSVANAAASVAKAITSAGGPTVYPARAGQSLTAAQQAAGAIGFNAAGQPINAAGQVIATPSWFSQSTLISGMTNGSLLLYGALGIAAVIALKGIAGRR